MRWVSVSVSVIEHDEEEAVRIDFRRKNLVSRFSYTYSISTISSILNLGLMQLHLLLLNYCFYFGVFGTDDFQEIFCQHFGSRYLAFIRSSRIQNTNTTTSVPTKE